MDLTSEDARWKLLRKKESQFQNASSHPVHPSFNNPRISRASSYSNSHSSKHHREQNDSKLTASLSRFTSDSQSIRRRMHIPGNDRSRRHQQDNHSDYESAMSTSSCVSTRSSHRKRRLSDDRRSSLDSTSNYPPFNRGKGSHHRYVNNDDTENQYCSRQARPRKEVKFVLSSSSRKRHSHFEDPAEEREYKIAFIGYDYLRGLTEKKPHEIVCEIVKSNSPFMAFLNEPELKPDWLMLVVEILKDICSSSFTGNINEMLNHVLRSQFMHALIYYLNDVDEVETNEETIAKIKTFVENLTVLLSSITNILPLISIERNVKKVITKTIKAIDTINSKFQAGVEETLKQKLHTLVMKLDNYENISKQKSSSSSLKGQQRSYQDEISEMSPPDDFRTISLYPTHDDLKGNSKFVFIRPNKVKGAYQDVEHYLDVQFRLLREDFIYPLRIGLKEYAEEKAALATRNGRRLKSKYESVRFYHNTKFESRSMTMSHEVGYTLIFDPERRLKISWSYSKRFMYGSLLLFTTNDFETFFCGTVLERDDALLRSGRIVVKLPLSVEITETFFEQTYLLAESEVFFEPYYHVMRRLQRFKENEFPMPKFIVSGEVVTELPLYLKPPPAPLREENPNAPLGDEEEAMNEPPAVLNADNSSSWIILGHLVDLTLGDRQWPTASMLKMDESQYEAFKTALTSNFCVIQGPPGTGKTFIGLKIMQVLLENLDSCRFYQQIKLPILVVCYTNHALDQFLEGIIPFTSKIVRAGSRSNSEALKRFNLRGLNQKFIRHQAQNVHSAKSSVVTEVKHLNEKIQKLADVRAKIEEPSGILKYELLESVMNDEQKKFLRSEREMVSWLLQPDYENIDYSWYADDQPVFWYDSQREGHEAKNEDIRAKKTPIDNEGGYSYSSDEDVNLVDELLDFGIPLIGSPFCVQYSDYKNIQQDFDQQMRQIENRIRTETNRKALSELMNEKRGARFSFKCKIREYEMLCKQLCNPQFVNSKQCQKITEENIKYLSIDKRWLLYWSWLRDVKEVTANKQNVAERDYAQKLEQLNEYRQIEDLYVIQRADVVGMTTTCAARLHHVLENIKPAIVIIEEAAEVLESHIVASLTNSCEQVILIGDHKQLKPSAAVYHLCKTYNFDVSLFERMFNNGMYCPMLRVQHRMRPEISKLITPLIYPNLEDHESVEKFEPVKGMRKSMFFLEHTEFEEEVHDSSSRKNRFEALFLLRLCEYLVHQGYNSTQITILTTYSGQMFLLREKKRQLYPALADVKCIVVDKYQGEENDIILLSLVRSNTDAKIGFLKTENRICVALSRAKLGLFIVGNMDNLRASGGSMWQNIYEILESDGALGKEMQLYCEKHELVTSVSKSEDFDKVSQGGCSMACAELMKCGHLCPSVCHKIDHEQIQCYEPCPRTCIRQHACKQNCYEKCKPCMVEENRKLPCSHETTLACHVDENKYVCEIIVDDLSPVCGHPIKRKCGEAAERTKCGKKCETRLDCGHACPRNCHKNDDPDHSKFKCRRPCERLNEKCSKSHQCMKQCFEDCGLCTVFETMTLPCGHQENLPCFTDLDEHKCFQRCEKSCPECEGKCKKRCHENCAPCPNLVTKTIEECGHKVSLLCSQEAIRINCSGNCERLAPCGHKCKSKCSVPCGSEKCRELVKTDRIQALCGHNDFVRIFCYRQDQVDIIDREKLLQHCRAPCDTKLKCGDICVGTCGLCWQGRMHRNCQEDCKNVLICGHTCKVKCREVCPPCDEVCGFKCEHSFCRKKCGVPCMPCQEKCKWRCKHLRCSKKCGELCNREPCFEACPKTLPCGHPCIGYCGEPCPNKCRECNPEIMEILFGWEDEPDARFVYLNDCGHVIESRALDGHLKMPPEGGVIVVKSCPLCKTPIVTTLRYMKIVKQTYWHILNIKRKVFGDSGEVKKKGMELLRSFDALREEHTQIIHSAKLEIISTVMCKFIDFLSGRIRRRYQTNVSRMEMTAISFFHTVIQTILSRLGDLFNVVERRVGQHVIRRGRSGMHARWYKNRTVCEYVRKTEIERHLDTSIAASKTIALVQRLMEKVDEIFLRLSQQQSEDISLEIARFTKMVDYCVAMRTYAANKDHEQVVAIRPKIEDILFGFSRFVLERREILENLFQELEKALKSPSPLTKEEKQMIHLAMSKDFRGGSQGKGHWFTCTRGHYYCITECGGPMQESNCPECGEKIGGRSHRYVDTMRVASDMDGATRPAWSTGNDMRNYGRFE